MLLLCTTVHSLLQWEGRILRGEVTSVGATLLLVSGSSRIAVDAVVHTALQTTILVPTEGCVVANAPRPNALETYGPCIPAGGRSAHVDEVALSLILNHARRHARERRMVNFSDGSFVAGLMVDSEEAGVFPTVAGFASLGVAGTELRGNAKERYSVRSFLLAEVLSKAGNLHRMVRSTTNLQGGGQSPLGARAIVAAGPRAAAGLLFPTPRYGLNHHTVLSGVNTIIVLRTVNFSNGGVAARHIASRRILFCRPFFSAVNPGLYSVIISSLSISREITFSSRVVGGAVVDTSCPFIVLPDSIYRAVLSDLCESLVPQRLSEAMRQCASEGQWETDQGLASTPSFLTIFLEPIAQPSEVGENSTSKPELVPWVIPCRELVVADQGLRRSENADRVVGSTRRFHVLLQSATMYFHPSSAQRLAMLSVIGAPAFISSDVALNPRPDPRGGYPSVGIVVTSFRDDSIWRPLVPLAGGMLQNLLIIATVAAAWLAFVKNLVPRIRSKWRAVKYVTR